ncbi:MAG: hypothetical protein ACRDZO_05870 [Egibacteraceae bacterium]
METTAVLAGVGYGWDVWYWLSLFFLLFLFLIGAPLIMHIWGSEPEPETQPQDGGEADHGDSRVAR